MSKKRVDVLLLERGLAESRTRAQALIMAGRVRAGDRVLSKPGDMIDEATPLAVEQPETAYASRGGEKLAFAFDRFGLDVAGLVALDVGASTGGFTDVLLRRDAQRVYAVDVGYGELAWALREDPRVVVKERTNIRYLESLPEQPDLATIDVSFISLEKVLPVVWRLLGPEGLVVALIKPQFEAGRGAVGKGGIVRDPKTHRDVLERVMTFAAAGGWHARGLVASPVLGINLGTLGFLAEMEPAEVPERLPPLVRGTYWVEERIMLQIEHWRAGERLATYQALNEAVVGRRSLSRVVRVLTCLNHQELTTYTADGVLGATATSSTACSQAAVRH